MMLTLYEAPPSPKRCRRRVQTGMTTRASVRVKFGHCQQRLSINLAAYSTRKLALWTHFIPERAGCLSEPALEGTVKRALFRKTSQESNLGQ